MKEFKLTLVRDVDKCRLEIDGVEIPWCAVSLQCANDSLFPEDIRKDDGGFQEIHILRTKDSLTELITLEGETNESAKIISNDSASKSD